MNTKWVATWRSGIAKFDGVNWTTFNSSNSGLSHDYVTSMIIDNYGSKWICTIIGGLNVYNENGIPNAVPLIDVNRNQLKIFPNPVSDFLTIDMPDENTYFVEIANIQGVVVNHHRLSGFDQQIDVRNLVAGVYIIRIHSQKGVRMAKMLKN